MAKLRGITARLLFLGVSLRSCKMISLREAEVRWWRASLGLDSGTLLPLISLKLLRIERNSF